jgi:glycosyltransferase involved in cell wall biosynthesis
MFARRMVGRQIAAGASSMWFLSTAHRDQFFEAAGLNAESMPAHFGPMPTEVATELTSSRGETRAALGLVKPTLLFMGRLVPIKGADVLLHAAAALERDVQVRIAGDGPERAALALLSHRLGIDVVFEGWVSGARKETLLRASNVLVVPSRPGDGLPTVLFEARARGLPIVTTRVGAIADYIQDGPRARVVAPGDPHVLSRAIDQLTA